MQGRRPFSDEEFRRLLEAMEGKFAVRDRALAALLQFTGFRISEVLSLSIGDVWKHDRVTDFVSVRRKNMKKKTVGRTVVLVAPAKRYLEAWIRVIQAEGLSPSPEAALFQSRKGRRQAITYRQAQRIVEVACEKAEISGPIGTHSFRKAFASKVWEASGHDLLVVQQSLGHGSVESTRHYLATTAEAANAVIVKMFGGENAD